ncbi:P-loop containing nucleoside triphosphate hydrolase protein [Obelidium mucronatum]|nr:P-loop containing nucleoside triphosphate hydrolase protein [Obelidium mucronatum]
MLEFSSSIEALLLKAIHAAIQPLIGSPMLFDAITTAIQFLQDYQDPIVDDHNTDSENSITGNQDDDDDDDDKDLDALVESLGIISTTSSKLTDLKSKNARGKWCHTVGLVGKPSAGKSTFFNAATRSLNARMGFHPFTTIDPNVAQGTWRAPQKFVPTRWVQEGKEVLIPCIIKDVAGLVPGAWEGRGRGNKFLNDLCDADVLIHVIDSSGLSDSDGNILPLDTPNPQDPLHDIQWVRNELFQWIYNNIAKKWDSIIKRPTRLPAMFSGYKAPRWLVHRVLTSAGFDTTVTPPFAKQFWSLHRLQDAVNAFLDARFPMLLAMNKADLEPAVAHIERVKDLFGSAFVVPVCAASELWLQAREADGSVEYRRSVYGSKAAVSKARRSTSSSFFDNDDDDDVGGKQQQEWERVQSVVSKFNGTGVDEALAAAIMLRPPVLCFPVDDFETLNSVVRVNTTTSNAIAAAVAAGSNSNGSCSCVAMKPGSTVYDCFELLAHGPDAVLNGQFVRAEAVGLDGLGKPKPIRKETEIDESCCIIKLMSNRKSKWQNLDKR